MKNTFYISLLTLALFALAPAQIRFAVAVGGTGIDFGNSVIQTTDGGFAVAGGTECFGLGSDFSPDLFLAKFSSTGAYEWSRTVGGTNWDLGNSVIQTTDGGFAIAGWTRSFGVGGSDFFLVKFSSTGSYEWSHAVGGTSDDLGYSVVQTSDSGFAVAGYTYSFGAGGRDLFLVKFSSTGAYQWSRAAGGTDDDYGMSVIQTTDGGLIVAGYTYSFGAGSYDFFLVKFSSAGAYQWSRALGGASYDQGISVVQTSDGGLAVAGATNSFGAGAGDLYLVRLTSTGVFKWSFVVGGMDADIGYSVIQTTDGGYAVAGHTYSFGAGSDDFILAKFDSVGSSCIGSYVSPTVTNVSPTITSTTPTVTTVTPTVTSVSPTVMDVSPTVMEICSELYISETIIKPSKLDISVSPNPFNSSCAISAPTDATIEIFDINGKCVGAFDKTPCVWTPEKEIGSGIYLIKATASNQTTTRRAILMK